MNRSANEQIFRLRSAQDDGRASSPSPGLFVKNQKKHHQEKKERNPRHNAKIRNEIKASGGSFSRLFPAFPPADPVDVALEIAAFDEGGQHVLLKGGHGAGIKAHLFREQRDHGPGQGHIAHAEGGGNGAGKGVQVNHVLPLGSGKDGFLGFAQQGEFRFKIVLHDEPAGRVRPPQIFPPLKKSYISLTSALMRQVLFLLPLTILFSKFMGMNGIWIGICTADALNFIYVIIMNIWVRKKVFTTWGKKGTTEA